MIGIGAASRRIPSGDKLLRSGAALRQHIGAAIRCQRPIDLQGGRLAGGSIDPVQHPIDDRAGEAQGVAKRVARILASDRGGPAAIEMGRRGRDRRDEGNNQSDGQNDPVQDLLTYSVRRLRRSRPNPIRPTPNMATVPGSGIAA